MQPDVTRPGVVLQGRYEVVGTLGAGGQGTVFEAVDRRLGIRVAVKRSVERRHELRQAFVREARLLASLRHPSLPIVSDYFVADEPAPEAGSGSRDAGGGAGGLDAGGVAGAYEGQYLVMELVPGEDLERRVSRQNGPCPLAEVLDWADQLLDALAYIHGQTPPIVHRDVKPRNVKLRPDGRLVLLDFGLAKGRPSQDESLGSLLSLSGYSHGFAPLEQMFRQGTDPRSDLYAVGATLYYLLTAVTPPDATVRDRELGRRGDPLRPLEALNPDVPGQIAGLIHHALELSPERRFQSAVAMRRALASARANLVPSTSGEPSADLRTGLSDVQTVIRARPGRATTASGAGVPEERGAEERGGRTAGRGPRGEGAPHRSHPAAGPRLSTNETPRSPTTSPTGQNAGGAAVLPPLPHAGEGGRRGEGPSSSPGTSEARAEPSGRTERPARSPLDGCALALAHGEQPVDRWALRTDRPVTIGRGVAAGTAPDVDLWPDRRVSREHARLTFEGGHWWLEDAGSKHGTRVDGRPLEPGRRVLARPWTEMQVGDTVLFLAPPGWRRLHGRDVVVDLDVVGAVSSSLVHAGLPIVGRVVARSRASAERPPGRLDLALEPCVEPVTATLPALAPGASAPVPLPPVVARYDVLEGQIERSRRRLVVAVDGEAARGEPVECWLLPHNEWSTLPAHRPALATFVLPNHPAVAGLCLEVVTTVGSEAPADRLLGALYDLLASQWQIAYRLEPPHWATDSQKVRLPHQVLLEDAARHGEGTCLDLALLVAACLENLGLQPLVAVVDLGDWWHALVGCWDPAGAALEPLQLDPTRLLRGSVWVDPTGATQDATVRRPFAAARAEAERCLREQPLLFALDVAAARRGGITPLPFAGTPAWSVGVGRAIEAARNEAQTIGGQLCSAALLAGLLAAGDRLTRRLVSSLGDPDRAAPTILGSLPPAPPGGDPTPGYRQVLSLARSRAKDAGSPLVLETHLLGALLAVRSTSLDRALAQLGSDQRRLAEALRELDGGPGELSGLLLST